MTIYVDADSCPRQVRAIIIRASNRLRVRAEFTADRLLPDCTGPTIGMHVVESGMDSADAWLADHADAGDICITRDILLAAQLVGNGCTVLDDRGSMYTAENIAERVSLRNAMTDLRESGLYADKKRPLSKRDIQQFANALDRQLTASLKDVQA